MSVSVFFSRTVVEETVQSAAPVRSGFVGCLHSFVLGLGLLTVSEVFDSLVNEAVFILVVTHGIKSDIEIRSLLGLSGFVDVSVELTGCCLVSLLLFGGPCGVLGAVGRHRESNALSLHLIDEFVSGFEKSKQRISLVKEFDYLPNLGPGL